MHLLLGGNYHEATLTNAAVEKYLGVATNRNLTVISGSGRDVGLTCPASAAAEVAVGAAR